MKKEILKLIDDYKKSVKNLRESKARNPIREWHHLEASTLECVIEDLQNILLKGAE